MLLAPARISSIGALNQRSTAVSTTRLPTISTSTDGITVMPSMRQHQLGAEAAERQAAPPFHHRLDDVARQHEHQRQQHRDVGRRERDQHDFGQEVRRQRGRAIGQPDDAAERGEQDDDAGEDQRRVVAKRPPRRRRRRPARRSRAGAWASCLALLSGFAVATARYSLCPFKARTSCAKSSTSRKSRYTDAKRT